MDDTLPMESDHAPPAVKVKRTYGRKKDASTIPYGGPATTTSNLPSPHEKERNATPHDGDAEEIVGSPAPITNFGWKAKLEEINKQFKDDDNNDNNPADAFTAKANFTSVAGTPATEDDSFTTANSSIFDVAPFRASSPATPESSPMPQNFKRKAKVVPGETFIDERHSSSASPSVIASSSRIRRKRSRSRSLSESDGEKEILPVLKLTRPSESPVTDKYELHEPGPSKQVKNSTTKATDKSRKIKKPTKKEETESRKAHARMMAEQKASVRKASKALTLGDFIQNLPKIEACSDLKSQPLQTQPSSDPIQQFSSPARKSHTARVAKPKPLQSQPSFPMALEDSDEELVDVKDILKHDKVQKDESDTKEQRRKALAEAKKKAIDEKSRKLAEGNQSDGDDDDLELEIVENESTTKGKLESKIRGLGVMRPVMRSFPVDLGETQVLKVAAQPHFSSRPTKGSNTFHHEDLLKIMRNKGMKQSEQITKGKEEDWVEKGGRLKPKNMGPTGGDAIAAVVERMRKFTEGDASGEHDEADEGTDEDWKPQNEGSGSETSLSEEEQEAVPIEQVKDVTMVNSFDRDEDENGYPRHELGRRPTYRHGGRTIVSDDDDDGSSPRPTKVLVPDTSMVLDSPTVLSQARARRTSFSSLDEASFDENENKENDMSLMFDEGEDKENLVVPRLHSPSNWGLSSSQNRKIFDLADGMRQRLSMSPNAGSGSSNKRVRNPLQQRMLDDDMDDEFPPLSATVVGSDSPARLHPSSSSSSPKPLRPAFGEGLSGFTQLFNEEDGDTAAGDENMPPPKSALKPAFSFSSSLSGDSQPRPLQFGGPLSFSAGPTQEIFGGMKPFEGNAKEISLTLDTKLQPALEVNTQTRRKADAIFEKEQHFVLEEALKKPQAKQELYVTENGLLTQTRPDVSTPIVYRSFSQRQSAIVPPDSASTLPPSTTQRLPLSTLSFTSDILSPTQPSRLSRLRKGPLPATEQEEIKIGSSSKNAFALMLEAQPKKQKAEAKKLEKSVFVEGEAQESDEDEEFGFGKKKGSKSDDDDSDDDDENAVIENLVDDSKREDEREDLVLEKVKEQRELDDQEIEKYHVNAVEGKYRGKRRGGRVGLDDSGESEEDDDDARRLRQRIHKKRRVAGDTLEELGKDEKSEAFVRGYEDDLHDDAMDDFAHLAQDEMEVDENDENEEPTETVDASEVQAQLRLAAQNSKRKGKQRFNPEFVDWAEQTNWSDDDEKYGVKDVEIPRKSAVGPRRQGLGQDGEMTLFTRQGEWDGAQLEAWRKEQSNRNFGTGGTRGAITVTGHGKKNGMSSKPSRAVSAATMGQEAEKRGMSRAASALATVSRKQNRFESD